MVKDTYKEAAVKKNVFSILFTTVLVLGIVLGIAGPVGAAGFPLTWISITGTAQVGGVLTAVVSPSGASATYQWEESATVGGIYTSISGATSFTYTPVAGDQGKFIEVVATGTPIYSGTVTSAATSAVAPQTPITGVSITGTAQVGGVLTAGVTPSGATATSTYQWQWSASAGGTYAAIDGATVSTYTPVSGDQGKFIEIVATGTGIYSGTVTSAATSAVIAQTLITAIGAITGTAQVGSTLTAGALTPSAATVTYQWQRCTTSSGTYAAISGATLSTYTPVAGDTTYYIEVVATGTGIYSGSATSAATSAVIAQIALSGVSITGTAQVGSVLTAVVAPSGATVNYQWLRSATGSGYTAIVGATSSTYTPVAGDATYYISVAATGTGIYSGSPISAITSLVTTPLTSVSITGTAQVGGVLTAVVAPSTTSVTYQWQWSITAGGTYSPISGATSATYTLGSGDQGKFIEVVATGVSPYIGTVTSAATSAVAAQTALTGVTITGIAKVGNTLTAVVAPVGAAVTYQWTESATAGGLYSSIPFSSIGSTYTLVTSDASMYIEVIVTGTGAYSGKVISATSMRVAAQTAITSVTIVITPPAIGETAQTSVGDGTGYTGTITWDSSVDDDGEFVAGTPLALIYLYATPGYTFTGMPSTGAVYIAGSEEVGYDVLGSSLHITVYYAPLTQQIVIASAAIIITTPVIGRTPQTSIGGTGYTGAVNWTASVSDNISGNKFIEGTPAATVVLTANTGYTFTGIADVSVSRSTSTTYVVKSVNTDGDTLTITVGWAPLYDTTLHLNNNGWTLVSTDNYIFTSGPQTSAFSGSYSMIYKYTGTGGWTTATIADLNPVTALYVKTTGDDGQLGLNYSGVQPAPSTIDLVAGWNLISTASYGHANDILSSLRYVQVGTQQAIGLATLVSQGSVNYYDDYNDYSDTFYVDATSWSNLSNCHLSPFDGYWVYMNAPTTFGVIPVGTPVD